MLLVTSGGSGEQIVEAGREAKRELWQRWIGLVQEANIIDSIVARYNGTGMLPWTWGVQNPDLPTPAPPIVGVSQPEKSRKDKILDKATLLLEGDSDVVRTADIAAQLRVDGDKTDARNLMTSIGNTLSRNGWERIGDGEYKLKGKVTNVNALFS